MASTTFALVAFLLAARGFEPALLRSAVPLGGLPFQAVGGGEVFLEVGVDGDGYPFEVVALRSTPLFTDLLREAVSQWRFQSARLDGDPVRSRVFIGGVFHAPTLYGPSLGELPKDMAAPSEEVPFPSVVIPALHPPDALWEGTVVVEVLVAEDGKVKEAKVVLSGERYDDPARQAALKWEFKPAKRKGSPVPSYAYLVFGFRQPITTD